MTAGVKGMWHRVPYELENGVNGVMLFADPDDHASEITLKLNVLPALKAKAPAYFKSVRIKLHKGLSVNYSYKDS